MGVLKLLFAPFAPIYHVVERAILLSAPNVSVDGIVIVDMNLDHADDAGFFRVTRDALALIRNHDARRYHVIRRELRFIVNIELTSGGRYRRGIRECAIDFPRYKVDSEQEHYQWRLARYASIIVHEATHGRIESLGVRYTPETRARIERLCCEEQRRFAKRLPKGRYDYSRLVPPFEEARWHQMWYGGPIQNGRALIARRRQSLAINKARQAAQATATHDAITPRRPISWDGGGTARPRPYAVRD